MLLEIDFEKLVRIILRRLILYCTKRMPPCIFETTLRHFVSPVCFCFVEVRFFLSCCLLLNTAKTCASLNLRCGTWFVFVLTKDVAFVSFCP